MAEVMTLIGLVVFVMSVPLVMQRLAHFVMTFIETITSPKAIAVLWNALC